MGPIAPRLDRRCHRAGCVGHRQVGAAPPSERHVVISTAGDGQAGHGSNRSRNGNAFGHELVRVRVDFPLVEQAGVRHGGRPPTLEPRHDPPLLWLELIEWIERGTGDRQRDSASEAPAEKPGNVDLLPRQPPRQATAVEPGRAESRGENLATRPRGDTLGGVLEIPDDELQGGIDAGPGLVAAQVISDSCRRVRAHATNAESPGGGVRRRDHWLADTPGTLAEVRTVRVPGLAMNGIPVGRLRSTVRPKHRAASESAVELQASELDALESCFEPQPVSLREEDRGRSDDRQTDPNPASQPHAPTLRRCSRYPSGVVWKWQTVHSRLA